MIKLIILSNFKKYYTILCKHNYIFRILKVHKKYEE